LIVCSNTCQPARLCQCTWAGGPDLPFSNSASCSSGVRGCCRRRRRDL
jgi:hypothetical protein